MARIKTKWQSLPQWKQILSISLALLAFSILDIKFLGLLNDISEGGQGIALILIALTAAPFAIWRMTITNEQKETDKQRLYTDSYIRAVGQLGAVKDNDPNLEVRTGGIYGLGKIARESENHHQEIIELLCAYIRENAKNNPKDEDPKPQRIDVQAALDVVGRHDTKWKKYNFFPDLNRAKFQNTTLNRLHFERFSFHGAFLEGAFLMMTHLEEASLINTHFEEATLIETHLEGARLYNTHLEGTNLDQAYLAEANLVGTKMEKAKNLTQEQIDQAFGDAATTLPPSLARPQHWPKRKLLAKEAIEEWWKWLKDKKNYQPPE